MQDVQALPTRRKRYASAPRVRAPRVGFTTVPRRWFADSTALTHLVNSVNLLFPAGERFFVRSVRHYMDQITDEELLAQIKGFFGQEGRHAYTHERYFETMRAQGYDVDGFLKSYEHIAYDIIEKGAPPILRLAVTVALEHYTAILAEEALSNGLLETAEPSMRALLEWHAVEELEHKCVAFDVLQNVDSRYLVRASGMVLATLILGGFWLQGMNQLLKEDGMTFLQGLRELGRVRQKAVNEGRIQLPPSIVRGVFLGGIVEYLRPGFHPAQKDHRNLIARTLERLAKQGTIDPAAEPS